MKSSKIFFILSFLLIPISSLSEDEDLINLSDYTYPKPTDVSYIYIPILSTNDLHGGIFPNIYSDINKKKYSNGGGNYLYSYKKILEEEWGDRLIWLDAGDQFQGTMECMLSDCLIMKDFYNKAGLEAITLGNHDFDYGIDYLKNYVEKMQYPLIVSNVKEKQSGKYIYDTWKNVEPYKIFNITIDPNDPNKFITIGVIGLALTSSSTQTSTDISSLEITNYIEETKKWNNTLRQEYNVNAVIVMTHFGPYCENDNERFQLKVRDYKTSQKLCEQDDEISEYLKKLKDDGLTIEGVIAGHRHDIAHHWISDIPVVESTGADYFNILYLAFRYVSSRKKYEFQRTKVQIEGPVPICEKLWNDTKNCVYKYEDSSLMKKFKFHGKEVILDQEMVDTLKFWENIINEKINNDLAETEDDMSNYFGKEETLLSNFINDVGKIITDSDICFFNSGGIRTNWYKGPINEIDLFKMLPFNNTWVRFEMTGEEVVHLIQDLNQYYIFPTSGLIQTFSLVKSNYYVKSLLVYDGFNERPLDLKKTYKVCTNDFLADGGGRMGTVRKWYKELRNRKDFGIIRDLVKDFLKKMKGKIREDKFVDNNHPKIIIEN